jgi:hypothetical protein
MVNTPTFVTSYYQTKTGIQFIKVIYIINKNEIIGKSTKVSFIGGTYADVSKNRQILKLADK